MTRVRIIVEGQTEEAFTKDVLAPALYPFNVYVTPTIIGRPGHQGGHVTLARVSRDLALSLKQDVRCYCTTFVDYYGLGSGFPDVSREYRVQDKVVALERSIFQSVTEGASIERVEARCFPYIQLHEFEGLLFSDVTRLAEAVYAPSAETQLAAIRNQFETPEDINDNFETAPSKRLKKHVSGYSKVLHGSLAAHHVGVEAMKAQCPRFASWFARLAGLSAN